MLKDEIIELAKFHSKKVPVVYGDGSCGTDEYVSISELNMILTEVFTGKTNGEVLQEVLPRMKVKEHMVFGKYKGGIEGEVHYTEHDMFYLWFPKGWWESNYGEQK